MLWTDPSGRCPNWLAEDCDFAGWDPRNWDWQGTGDYIKGSYGLESDASVADVAVAATKTVYEPFYGPAQSAYNLATNPEARAALAETATNYRAWPRKVLQPWDDTINGFICNDSNRLGRGIIGAGGQILGAAGLAEGGLAVRNLLRRSSAVVRPYGKMSGTLDDGFQANHLNQNAAYKSIIPENEGAALGLRGNAFTEPGTPHYRFHESLEKFWDQYRRGGAKYPQVPTNAEYSQGLKEALRASGLSQRDAAAVEAMARTNREAYGLSDTDPVPRIPRKIYQRGQ